MSAILAAHYPERIICYTKDVPRVALSYLSLSPRGRMMMRIDRRNHKGPEPDEDEDDWGDTNS